MTQPSTPKKINKIVIAGVVIAVLLIALVAAWIMATQTGSGGGNLFNPTPTPTPAPTPVPDFSIQTGDSSGTVMQGNSIQTTVYINWLSGNYETTTLSGDGGSSGIQCSFSPTSSSPDFSSTLTMSVPTYTSTNPYSVTITATNGAVSHSTSYTVSVLSAQVYVSGTVTTTGVGASPSQIQFVDQQTGLTYTGTLSDNNYSITLDNEHTYTVTVNWKGLLYSTGTFSGGSLYVYAPVGYTSMSQDYSG